MLQQVQVSAKTEKSWALWHGFRILTHTIPNMAWCNPEVSGSLARQPGQVNPLPATISEASIPLKAPLSSLHFLMLIIKLFAAIFLIG